MWRWWSMLRMMSARFDTPHTVGINPTALYGSIIRIIVVRTARPGSTRAGRGAVCCSPVVSSPETEVVADAEAHFRDWRRCQLPRERSDRLVARPPAQVAWAAHHDAEARPVHQRRPRH